MSTKRTYLYLNENYDVRVSSIGSPSPPYTTPIFPYFFLEDRWRATNPF